MTEKVKAAARCCCVPPPVREGMKPESGFLFYVGAGLFDAAGDSVGYVDEHFADSGALDGGVGVWGALEREVVQR